MFKKIGILLQIKLYVTVLVSEYSGIYWRRCWRKSFIFHYRSLLSVRGWMKSHKKKNFIEVLFFVKSQKKTPIIAAECRILGHSLMSLKSTGTWFSDVLTALCSPTSCFLLSTLGLWYFHVCSDTSFCHCRCAQESLETEMFLLFFF